MILGIDLGNFNIKTSTGVMFKSTYTTDDNTDILNECETLTYEGTTYYISKGKFDTEFNKSKKDTMPLFLYALGKSTKASVVDVILGLPVDQFKDNKASMEKKYKGQFEFTMNGELRNITVKRVKCFPECIGAFYSLDEKYDDRDFILIDVGGRTTNIALFEDGEHVESTSVAMGMLNILDELRKEINQKYTLDKTIEDADRWIRKGLIVDGEDVDIDTIKNRLVNKLLDEIFDELKLNYPIRTTEIILTGGGSKQVFNYMCKRHFKVGVVDDYLLANAVGFQKVGEAVWQQGK